jgi:hypothetical protein
LRHCQARLEVQHDQNDQDHHQEQDVVPPLKSAV